MSVLIDIHPLSESLDMYGEPDTSSAYSLSGHVSISLTSPYSMFHRRRPAHFLLQSVSLTFEGQSELITPKMGYAATRICTITHDVGPSDPVELSNEGHEDSSEPCTWNVVFNVPIPGWLPATSILGPDQDIGTSYFLFATAKFTAVDDHAASFLSFSTLCAPFRFGGKSVSAEKPILLKRFAHAPSPTSSTVQPTTYLVNTVSEAAAVSDSTSIPPEVLSKIRVLASLPEYVDIDSSTIPLTIRLRTKDLDREECRRLQLTYISVDVKQIENYRRLPSSEYRSHHPILRSACQPPNKPLRRPHPAASIYELGFYIPPGPQDSVCSRTLSLLPNREAGRYDIEGDSYVFANDAEPSDTPTWYTMETIVPFSQKSRSKDDPETWGWAGAGVVRPATVEPLFSVRHELQISLACSYNIPGSDLKATDKLDFAIPFSFTPFTVTPPSEGARSSRSHSPSTSVSSVEAPLLGDVSAPIMPHTYSLPAYSQLFDSNGDRKIDHSIPLPLYTPRSSAPSLLPLEVDLPASEGKEPLLAVPSS